MYPAPKRVSQLYTHHCSLTLEIAVQTTKRVANPNTSGKPDAGTTADVRVGSSATAGFTGQTRSSTPQQLAELLNCQ